MDLALVGKFAAHAVRAAVKGNGTTLAEGIPAPDFKVQDESGNTHTLSQYRGKRVVLWFFPRANTGG
jgi:peroxiredoxin